MLLPLLMNLGMLDGATATGTSRIEYTAPRALLEFASPTVPLEYTGPKSPGEWEIESP